MSQSNSPRLFTLSTFMDERNVMLGFCLQPRLLSFNQDWLWVSLSTLQSLPRLPALADTCYKFHLVSLYSRNDNLCKVCGKYYEDESEICHYHPGQLRTFSIGDYETEEWTCCHSLKAFALNCASGPHSRLTISGFASSLTYWIQIRLLLALKYEANNDVRYLPNELVDLFIWKLVELNDSCYYDL